MSNHLEPCPCGKVPDRLVVDGEGQRPKWAWVSGVCCHGWDVEFRNQHAAIGSPESDKLAREAWNSAPRAAALAAVTAQRREVSGE